MDLMEKYVTDIVDELEGMASVDPMVRRARDEIIRLRAQVADLTRLAGCAAVGKSFTDYKNETAEVRRKGLALLGLSEEPNHD
jgi:hypothetical protein